MQLECEPHESIVVALGAAGCVRGRNISHFPFSVRLVDTLIIRQNGADILDIFGKIFLHLQFANVVVKKSRIYAIFIILN